jgi:signal transduction histidine kinase
MSIRFKVVFVVIVVMTLVFSALLAVVTLNMRRHQDELEARMRNTLTPIVQRLVHREGWSANRTRTELGAKLNEAVDYKLIKRYVVVRPNGGLVSRHNVDEGQVRAFVGGDEILARAMQRRRVLLYPDEKFIAVPVSVAGQDFGAIKLEVNTGPRPTLQETALETFTTLFAIIAFFTIVLITATYLLFHRLVLKPLLSIVDASHRVAEGDYSVRLDPGNRRDEMKDLMVAFNAMTSDVRDYHFNLERKVEEATGRFKEAQKRLVIAQRLAATGTLAAGIAHEVNNPLGGMINATRRLLKEAGDDDRRREYLKLIEEGLERVQTTVSKILSFAPRDIHPQPVAFRDITHKAIELVRHKAEINRIAMANEVPEALPTVFGDPSELQQVMLNLLMNAVDAIGEEGGEITVQGRHGPEGIEIRITDTGHGMDEEMVAKAFDLFFTTKEVGKGTGLGLSIVHNIITNHQGRMNIQSEPGKGTTVEIVFPIVKDRQSGRYKLLNGDAGQGA